MARRHYLITHRKKWALTQGELGLLLGLSRSTISTYERHLALPSFQVALRLEVTFGKTAGHLFPVLYDENEEAVMAAAVAIRNALDGKHDKTSERKRALLDDMMRRATETPST
jgi:DNA-binding XRE family transcriptional regulator